MFASIILVSEEHSITHYKRLSGPVMRMRQPLLSPSMAINVVTSIVTAFGSTPHGKLTRKFDYKTNILGIQKFSDSKFPF